MVFNIFLLSLTLFEKVGFVPSQHLSGVSGFFSGQVGFAPYYSFLVFLDE